MSTIISGIAMVPVLALMALLAIGCSTNRNFKPQRTLSMHQSQPTHPTKTGHAPVNGIQMYYELHGRADGVPLVLLHGGGSTIEVTFGKVLPVFAAGRRVIAVEEQGHGRTSDRDAPVAFET